MPDRAATDRDGPASPVATPPDPSKTGWWQNVKCADCGDEWVCTPLHDHFLVDGEPEGSPRVCYPCLLRRWGFKGVYEPGPIGWT